MSKRLPRSKVGSGPPFSVTVEVTLHCPGTRECNWCSGSAANVDKMREQMESGETTKRDPLWFCADYLCPFHRGEVRQVSYRVTAVDSLHLKTED